MFFSFFCEHLSCGSFCAFEKYCKTVFFSMSLFRQKSFSENKNVQKRDMRMPFWAILGHFGPFYVPFLAKAFSGKQETPIFGHASAPFYPKNTVLWHPPKRAKVIFRKQETPILGHAFSPHPFYPRPRPSPENGKSDFLKTRNPVFGTVLNDNPMITLR